MSAAQGLHENHVGGRSFSRGSVIERSYRDIRAAKFHPLSPELTLLHGGQWALGLPADRF